MDTRYQLVSLLESCRVKFGMLLGTPSNGL